MDAVGAMCVWQSTRRAQITRQQSSCYLYVYIYIINTYIYIYILLNSDVDIRHGPVFKISIIYFRTVYIF